MLLRKSLSLTDCDIKMDGDSGRFAGYASVFGGVDSYGDTILKGAFETTLRRDGKPKMFYGHDAFSGIPIGKWLTAKEDDKGLFVEGELTLGVSLAQDVRAALQHGTLDGLSIGGYLKAGDFDLLEDGRRLIKKWSKLVEISVVSFPADSAARVDLASVKSAVEELQSIQDFERFLRDAGGFSREAAKTLVSRAKDLLNLRDAGQVPQAKQDDDELAALALRLRSIRAPS